MIIHVDDVMICHDESAEGSKAASELHERFLFGTWMGAIVRSNILW